MRHAAWQLTVLSTLPLLALLAYPTAVANPSPALAQVDHAPAPASQIHDATREKWRNLHPQEQQAAAPLTGGGGGGGPETQKNENELAWCDQELFGAARCVQLLLCAVAVGCIIMAVFAWSQRRTICGLLGLVDEKKTEEPAEKTLLILPAANEPSAPTTEMIETIAAGKADKRKSYEAIQREILAAKSAGQSYEDWLEASMPGDYYAEFVTCSRQNLRWHEMWHWTAKPLDAVEPTEPSATAEDANGPSQWVRQQALRLTSLRESYPGIFDAAQRGNGGTAEPLNTSLQDGPSLPSAGTSTSSSSLLEHSFNSAVTASLSASDRSSSSAATASLSNSNSAHSILDSPPVLSPAGSDGEAAAPMI